MKTTYQRGFNFRNENMETGVRCRRLTGILPHSPGSPLLLFPPSDKSVPEALNNCFHVHV